MQLGASVATDRNPANPVTLLGATAVVKLDPRSVVTAEIAQSDTGESGRGHAGRLEWLKDSEGLKVRAQATVTDSHFDNVSAGFGKGRAEATVDATYRLVKDTALRLEGIYSKDQAADTERGGLLATVSTPLGEYLRAEAGARISRSFSSAPVPVATGQAPSAWGAEIADLTTLRGKLSARVPALGGANVYVEAEQDVRQSERRMAAIGGDYQVTGQAKLYGRYELISSLGNPYQLSSAVQNNQGVIGLETSYLQDGRTFNEFRLRDTANGRELQAASGVRRTWAVSERWRMGGSFENTRSFGGVAGNNATAVTGSAEYTGDPRLRLYSALELRNADAGDSWLANMGLAYKLDKDWSLLARSASSTQKNASDGSRLKLARHQFGFAWREVDRSRWNVLGRYEYNLNDNTGGEEPKREVAHIVSLHANYQPTQSLVVSGRYAFKRAQETWHGVTSDFTGQLLYGRVTADLGPRSDVSIQAASLWGAGGARKLAFGVEAGVHLVSNLWLSVGYNLTGFARDVITSGEYLEHGIYLRVRYKFDEKWFQ